MAINKKRDSKYANYLETSTGKKIIIIDGANSGVDAMRGYMADVVILDMKALEGKEYADDIELAARSSVRPGGTFILLK